jgi:hypothetical protein
VYDLNCVAYRLRASATLRVETQDWRPEILYSLVKRVDTTVLG